MFWKIIVRIKYNPCKGLNCAHNRRVSCQLMSIAFVIHSLKRNIRSSHCKINTKLYMTNIYSGLPGIILQGFGISWNQIQNEEDFAEVASCL